MSLKAPGITSIWLLCYRTNSSLQTSALIVYNSYLFLFIIKIFSCYLIWNSFWRFLWAQLGNSFFEVPHLFIFCQWQALYAPTFYTFHSYFKIYFIWRRVNLSSCTHSHFSFLSFLSLWHSAKFIRALSPLLFLSSCVLEPRKTL